MKVKFITTEYLKDNTAIEKNVDDSLIVPQIYIAQDLQIGSKLGPDFYEYLKAKVVAGTLNNDEKTLLDEYICPALAHWSYYYIMPHTFTKTTNQGEVQGFSQYSASADQRMYESKRSVIENIAQAYSTKLVDFLCRNTSSYPQYLNQSISPSKRTYFSGIHYPRYNKTNGYSEQEHVDGCGCDRCG